MPLSVRPLLGIFQLRIWFRFSDLSHTSMWQINLSKEDLIIFSPTLEKISDKKGENIAVLIIHFFWVRRWNHQYILLCGYNSFFPHEHNLQVNRMLSTWHIAIPTLNCLISAGKKGKYPQQRLKSEPYDYSVNWNGTFRAYHH